MRELNAGIDLMEFRPSEIAAAVAIFVTQETQIVELTDKAFSFLSDHVEKVKFTSLKRIHNFIPLLILFGKVQKTKHGLHMTYPIVYILYKIAI